MGSQFVTDPFWGSLGSSMMRDFENAPAKALQTTHLAESIADQRIKRAREAEAYGLTENLLGTVEGAVPQAYAAPRPYTAADISDPARLDTPLSHTDRDSKTGADVPLGTFTDPRELAAAEARRRFAVSGIKTTLFSHPEQWAPQLSQGEVTSAGVPTNPYERARIQFGTTGKFPTAEETKTPNAQNFAIVNADGTGTGQGFASLNGGRTAIDGTPIRLGPGQRIMETGSAPLGQPNLVETAPIAQKNFYELAARIQAKVANGEAVSDAELNQARLLRDNGWTKEIKIEKNAETGATMPITVFKIPPPTSGAASWLFDTLDAVDGRPARPQAPQAPVTGGDPNVSLEDDPTAGSLTGLLGLPETAPAPAPGPRPLVEPQPTIGPGDPSPVVTRYMHQPVVIALENAKNGYSALLGNIANDDKTADLAIIVGAAKILDPPSVVREGEVENVRKTGGVMDKFIGMIEGAKGHSGLSKQVRAQLWQMVNSKLENDAKNAGAIREQHAVQLRERNINPDKYLPALPEIVPVDPGVINSKRINVKGGPVTGGGGGGGGGGDEPVTDAQREATRKKLLGH